MFLEHAELRLRLGSFSPLVYRYYILASSAKSKVHLKSMNLFLNLNGESK